MAAKIRNFFKRLFCTHDYKRLSVNLKDRGYGEFVAIYKLKCTKCNKVDIRDMAITEEDFYRANRLRQLYNG